MLAGRAGGCGGLFQKQSASVKVPAFMFMWWNEKSRSDGSQRPGHSIRARNRPCGKIGSAHERENLLSLSFFTFILE